MRVGLRVCLRARVFYVCFALVSSLLGFLLLVSKSRVIGLFSSLLGGKNEELAFFIRRSFYDHHKSNIE